MADAQFTLQRSDFTVTFPPQCPQPQEMQTKAGTIDIHLWRSENPGMICRAGFWDFERPPQTTTTTLRAALAAINEGLTEESADLTSIGGCPSARAFFSSPNAFGRTQVILRRRRLYIALAYSASRADLASPSFNAFFDSFKLLGIPCDATPAAEPMRANAEFKVTYPPGSSAPERKAIEPKESDVWIETSAAASGTAIILSAPLKNAGPPPDLHHVLAATFRDATFESEEKFSKNGHAATRAIVRLKTGFARAEAILGKSRAYVLAFSSADREALSASEIDRFFNSFELIEH